MANASTINETARIAGRTSCWASVTGAQYAQVNKDVDKDMGKSVWPSVTDNQIKKGLLKTTSCTVPEITADAKHRYVDVMGQPLHHNDCPFWFEKMLYMQVPCAICHFVFHAWSVYYMVPCGCMYHLSCLVQSMLESPKCFLCKRDMPKNLYLSFNMGGEYER